MKATQKMSAVVLVVLLGAAVYGFLRTGQDNGSAGLLRRGKPASAGTTPLVDQTSLKTAQQLAHQPTTEEEKPFAEEALRLADKAVDLAFVQALHDADEHPPVLNADAREALARLEKSQTLLAEDKARVDQLDEAMDKATGDKKDAIDKQLDLMKAQADLDQDEADETKQDLIRAGGDWRDRINAMRTEHEQWEKASGLGPAPAEPGLGLLRWMQHWWTLHQKQMALWAAKAEAEARGAALTARHNGLDQQVETQKASTPALEHHAKKKNAERKASRDFGAEEAGALLDTTQRLARNQTALAS